MRRFIFRLESILKIRKFELERAVAALATVEADRVRRQAKLDKAEVDLETGRALLASDAAAGADGEYLALRADGVAAGRFTCVVAQRNLNELSETLRVARERVAKARVEVRSIERLREKRLEAHQAESQSVGQAEIEELARAGAQARGTGNLLETLEEVR